MEKLKLAILDMYDGAPNQGMRAIKSIIDKFADSVDYEVFDVRGKVEIPNLEDYGMFISTGGPGNPLEGDGVWDSAYFNFIDKLWAYNGRQEDPSEKKYAFFICHSFQMISHHFELGKITKRYSTSFGTFPVHKTKAGKEDLFFQELRTPFYVADFRDYQFVQPNKKKLKELGAKVLCLEKIRPRMEFERAVMALRFSDEFFATQFHPEADPEGMLIHFQDPKRKEMVIKEHGEMKFEQMINDLSNPYKIEQTYNSIIPSFIKHAISKLQLKNTLIHS